MECRDYREIVAAHVDGALTAAEELEVQAHLDRCPKCKQMFDWETKATTLLKQSLSPLTPRHELKQNLLDRLGEGGDSAQGWLSMSRAWVPALSLLLIVGTMYLVWSSRIQKDIFTDTATQYQQAIQGLTSLSQPHETTPMARLLDLRPWGYHLVGKSVYRVKGRENRVFVYQGPQNDLLVAQEFDGESLSPARGSVIVRKSGKNFVSLTKGDINLVAWQDKNFICVLASNLSQDRIVALAEQIAIRS